MDFTASKTRRRYSPEEIAKRTERILKHSFSLNGGKLTEESKKKMGISRRRWDPDNPPLKKPCNDCGKLRKREEYYTRRSTSDGKHSTCISCMRKQLYGLSEIEYSEMFIRQNGVCAICKLPEMNREISVDHDHKTGKVRGLLCTGCNLVIGKIKTIELLESAIDYLKESL